MRHLGCPVSRARVVLAADGRRVPAVELAPGLYAALCDACCPCETGPWRLITGGGVWVAAFAFDVPLPVLRAAAAELAGLPVPWHRSEAEVRAALDADPGARERARAVLRRLTGLAWAVFVGDPDPSRAAGDDGTGAR